MRRLCQTLKVHPSGYYAWLAEPQSARAKEDQRLLGLIKHAWLESGGVYGYRKIHDDLRELGEICGRNRVGRLMHVEGLRMAFNWRIIALGMKFEWKKNLFPHSFIGQKLKPHKNQEVTVDHSIGSRYSYRRSTL